MNCSVNVRRNRNHNHLFLVICNLPQSWHILNLGVVIKEVWAFKIVWSGLASSASSLMLWLACRYRFTDTETLVLDPLLHTWVELIYEYTGNKAKWPETNVVRKYQKTWHYVLRTKEILQHIRPCCTPCTKCDVVDMQLKYHCYFPHLLYHTLVLLQTNKLVLTQAPLGMLAWNWGARRKDSTTVSGGCRSSKPMAQ